MSSVALGGVLSIQFYWSHYGEKLVVLESLANPQTLYTQTPQTLYIPKRELAGS